ncbi:MAG TPA: FAD-binding oxidoreductase, partial [Candidatus Dormibacteraeota bacterium]|nr:FAD-binding oxidoreductase [Candidatus Dormibacteraeota bacterium]
VQAPDSYPIDTPSVYDFVNGLSFRPEGTGHTVVAEGSSYFKGALDADGYPTQPSDRYIEDVSLRLARAMPRLAEGTPRGGWAGLLEGTPDFHPVLGAAPGLEGMILCYGFSGHGFKEAPVTGRLIAELILDGRPSLDIEPLSFERFAAGRLLRSLYKDDPIMA